MRQRKKKSSTKDACLRGVLLVVLVAAAVQWGWAKSLESYLHPNAILAASPLSSPPGADVSPGCQQRPIAPRAACLFAIRHLQAKGVGKIVICEVQWLAAPLSGYLVDARGTMVIGHLEYSTFRIGVTDGFCDTDGRNPAGNVFVFIAFQKDASGRKYWYPRPGPDDRPNEGAAVPESFFAYEFLLGRERFEAIAERYL